MRKFHTLIVFCFFIISCKKNKSKTTFKTNYPYFIKFNEGYITYNNKTKIIVERYHYTDTTKTNKIHLLKIENDSVIISTKIIKDLPVFIKDIYFDNKNLNILSSKPRTLGNNLKSTDFIRTYSENLETILRKDLDISKYPSGDSFMVNSPYKFYVTGGFKYKEKPSLFICKVDSDFNIINQKTFKDKSNNIFRYDPLKFIFIKNIGLIVSYKEINMDNYINFKIAMFDLDLNKIWSKTIDYEPINIGYLEKENNIVITTIKNLQFWNTSGIKTYTHNPNTDILCSTIGGNHVFLLTSNFENLITHKIPFKGKSTVILIKKIKKNENNYFYLNYENKNLFLMNFNKKTKTISIDKYI